MSRQQYVLDLTRQEVVDYIYERVAGVIRSANIEYVKWDMNRPVADAGSMTLGREHMENLCTGICWGVPDAGTPAARFSGSAA